MMPRLLKSGFVALLGLLMLVSGCSKTKAKANPCDLLNLGDTQALDGTIAKAQWLPAKEGQKDELCMYYDQNGEARLMLFVWRDASIQPLDSIKSGMGSASARIIEISGVGDKAAAGFAGDSEALKLFAARSKDGMVGIRVRDLIKEGDEKFALVKTLAGTALTRMK